jgi:hypothetical protein
VDATAIDARATNASAIREGVSRKSRNAPDPDYHRCSKRENNPTRHD